MNIKNIPDELKEVHQWIVWRYVQRKQEKKPTKPPYSAKTLQFCNVTDPNSWGSFEEALAAYQKHKFDGIGFALANGYCGVDLDYCVNAETLEIEPHAEAVIERLNSYSEFSPSKTGLHCLVKATLKGSGLAPTINGKKYELFGSSAQGTPNKYFTVTGFHIASTALEVCERQNPFDELYDWVKEKSTNQKKGDSEIKGKASISITLADEELLAFAQNAKNGVKFQRLWSGDSSEYANDVSDADQAFVDLLCFWSQNNTQVERLWKSSRRYRGKLERDDYITRTIATARASQIASYTGEHLTDEVLDLTDLDEIADDEPTLTEDLERNKYLRKCARNAAKVMEAYTVLLRLLGFQKNHLRFLNALTAIGRDRLGTFIAAQKWIREKYQENAEASSEETVKRDIRKLMEEQAELGITLISYKPGSMNLSTGEKFASKFQNHLLRYSLLAISRAIDIREDYKYSSAALEAACQEIIVTIPRLDPQSKITTRKGQRIKSIEEINHKMYEIENLWLERLLASRRPVAEIESEIERRKTDLLRRLREATESGEGLSYGAHI
jgi:hypothetical protein